MQLKKTIKNSQNLSRQSLNLQKKRKILKQKKQNYFLNLKKSKKKFKRAKIKQLMKSKKEHMQRQFHFTKKRQKF